VHFTPDVQAKLEQMARDTGRPSDELAQMREKLNSRYDDLKSGRVKPISGDEVEAYFREKSAAARRSRQPGS
jgi:hypothetical protein